MIVNLIVSLRSRPQNVHQSEKASLALYLCFFVPSSVLTMFNYQESTQAQTVLNERRKIVLLFYWLWANKLKPTFVCLSVLSPLGLLKHPKKKLEKSNIFLSTCWVLTAIWTEKQNENRARARRPLEMIIKTKPRSQQSHSKLLFCLSWMISTCKR